MTTSRREFLKSTLATSAVVSLSSTAPQFLLQAAETPKKDAGENILVVVQLSGGNDGLNTIVPFKDETYYASRSQLGIPADDLLKINDQAGFHPSLRGFADLLEDGNLAIVDLQQIIGRNARLGWRSRVGQFLDIAGTYELSSQPHRLRQEPIR